MSEAAEFDALVSDFYRVWFRCHPIAAIYAGVPGYEGLRNPVGDDDMGALPHPLSNLLALRWRFGSEPWRETVEQVLR